jgi:hypothetical protein
MTDLLNTLTRAVKLQISQWITVGIFVWLSGSIFVRMIGYRTPQGQKGMPRWAILLGLILGIVFDLIIVLEVLIRYSTTELPIDVSLAVAAISVGSLFVFPMGLAGLAAWIGGDR